MLVLVLVQATPTVAGLVALLRQYYVDGYYPTNSKGTNEFNPSGALLKATVVHSGKAMTGKANYDVSGNNAPNTGGQGGSTMAGLGPPSIVQGWGRVDASNVLPLKGSEQKMWLYDYLSHPDGGVMPEARTHP